MEKLNERKENMFSLSPHTSACICIRGHIDVKNHTRILPVHTHKFRESNAVNKMMRVCVDMQLHAYFLMMILKMKD